MRNRKVVTKVIALLVFLFVFTVIYVTFNGCTVVNGSGCTVVNGSGSESDINRQEKIEKDLLSSQPTPTDIDFSLERYNLVKRAYWVNGQREKAAGVICSVQKPLGYIVLFSGNTVVGSFIVDGKVSSLNSYLTPDSEYYEYSAGSESRENKWLADVDGSYGENDSGIFFFTPDGKYIERTGEYLYSDIPFEVQSPVVTYKVGE